MHLQIGSAVQRLAIAPKRWNAIENNVFRSAPGSVILVVSHNFYSQNLPRTMPEWGQNWVQNASGKGSEFCTLFSWIFGVFRVVFFATFLDSAFSNEGCCCKVRHVRIVCYLYIKLMIFKFHVFLWNAKKHEISSGISMPKTSEILIEISSENGCRKHWKSDEN